MLWLVWLRRFNDQFNENKVASDAPESERNNHWREPISKEASSKEASVETFRALLTTPSYITITNGKIFQDYDTDSESDSE